VRENIAKRIGTSTDKIKSVFTSLGFGAKLSNSPFTAIRKELGAESYKALIQDQEFMFIKQALDRVNKTIAESEHFKQDTFQWCNRTYLNVDRDGDKRTTSQKLAWIYQTMERHALDIFLAHAEQEPILTTHDCLYFKQKLPARVVNNVQTILGLEFPLLNFEHNHIIPIMTDEDYKIIADKQNSPITEHKILPRKVSTLWGEIEPEYFPQDKIAEYNQDTFFD
jgi:hypothetical protein